MHQQRITTDHATAMEFYSAAEARRPFPLPRGRTVSRFRTSKPLLRGPAFMDVFQLRQTLISKYQDYVRSFILIRNKRVRELVDAELKEGLLWPRPLVQLNPFFERGKTIEELAD